MQQPAKSGKTVSQAISADRISEVEEICQKIFGAIPDRVAFPGGESRSAFVVDISGELYVIAKREDEASAMLEAQVLKAFNGTHHAPEFVARHKEWLVQECILGERLPVVIDNCSSMENKEKLISEALDALLVLHSAARDASLQHRIQKVGATDEWYSDLLSNGEVISKKLKIAKPVFDKDEILSLIKVKHTDFVKRDARPGNAMVLDGRIYWFDFEDCGRRRAIDDLVWVICDEWTSIDEATEDRLIEQYLPRFSGALPAAVARRYLYVYGVMHMMWRLRLIVKYRHRDKKWWDRDMCLSKDKIGITAEEATRTCQRLRRWSAREPLLALVGIWVDDVARKLELDTSSATNINHAA